MSHNSFGHLFRFTTWGESHGPAIGCVVDGVPPRIALSEADIQPFLDRRRPGQSKFVTQRQEPDQVRILSGVMDGLTTGTPIAPHIENTDQRSKDYSEIAERFRPGHADVTYELKYGIRDYRGGGRSSARETAMRVAAGAVARKVLGPDVRVRGAMVAMGGDWVDPAAWDWAAVQENAFFCPDRAAAARWEERLLDLRKSGNSVGAVIEVVAEGVPPGLGAPIGDISSRAPFGDGFRVHAMAAGQSPQARLTMLDRATDRLCRAGAAVENLAHSASLHAGEKTAASKPGTKHLGHGRASQPVPTGLSDTPPRQADRRGAQG